MFDVNSEFNYENCVSLANEVGSNPVRLSILLRDWLRKNEKRSAKKDASEEKAATPKSKRS